MRYGLRALLCVGSLLLGVPSVTHATFHVTSISELGAGFGNDPAIQFVEPSTLGPHRVFQNISLPLKNARLTPALRAASTFAR